MMIRKGLNWLVSALALVACAALVIVVADVEVGLGPTADRYIKGATTLLLVAFAVVAVVDVVRVEGEETKQKMRNTKRKTLRRRPTRGARKAERLGTISDDDTNQTSKRRQRIRSRKR